MAIIEVIQSNEICRVSDDGIITVYDKKGDVSYRLPLSNRIDVIIQ